MGDLMKDDNKTKKQLVHELTELRSQNAAPGKTESAEKYRSLVESIRDVIYELDSQGVVLYISPGVRDLLGYDTTEIVGKSFIDLAHKDDLSNLTEWFSELRKGRESPSEYRIINKAGEFIWARTKTRPIMEDGMFKGARGIIIDVTDQRRVEEALRESEKKYRLVVDNMADVIAIMDMNLRFTYVSPSIMRMRGYTVEEATAQTLEQVMTPESLQIIAKAFEEEMKSEASATADPGRTRILELEEYRKDGSIVWIENHLSFTRDEAQKPVGIISLSHDITDRKEAEAKLRQQTDAMDAAIDGMAILNAEGEYVYLNKAHAKIYGYENVVELIGKSWRLLYDSGVLQYFDQEIMPEFSRKGNWHGETIGTKKNGSKFPQELSLTAMADGGLICVVRDITERKKSEDEIRKLASVIQFSSDLVNIVTLDEKMIFLNEAGCTMLGIDPDKVCDYSIMDIVSEPFIPTVRQELLPILLTGKNWDGELQYRNIRTGVLTDVHAMTFTIKDTTTGALLYMANVSHDITKRKQVEDTLRESEEKYRTILENMDDFYFEVDIKGNITFVNPSSCKMSGYSEEELLGMPFKKISAPDGIEMVKQYFGEIFLTDKTGKAFLWNLVKKNGEQGFSELVASLIRDKQGKPIGFKGIGRDVTERKRTEAALLESENKFRAFMENMPSMVIIKDEGLRPLFFNRKFSEMFPASEWLGKIPEETFPSDIAESMRKNDLKALSEGFVAYEEDWRDKDGCLRVLETRKFSIDQKDKAPFLGVIITDITERKRAEENLKEILESLRKAIKTTIQVLGTASEARDPYTAGHQKRVADLARVIATEMGLPHDTIEGIRMAGSIHDIGKLSIPAEILSKPTKLTGLEFSLIKVHSQSGYEMLKDVESPWPLAQIVYQHHERMNGSGYPRNLKGNEILLESRILAVADVVEAMASHRPYRPTLGIKAALEEIEKNKGILYDNTVVDTCLKLFREKDYQLIT
jgi:PAS domain S-box-containing protein